MQTVKIVNPLNPNLYTHADVPCIGEGLELNYDDHYLPLYDLYFRLAGEYLEPLKGQIKTTPKSLLNRLKQEVGDQPYDTLKIGLILYKLNDLLAENNRQDLLPDIETYFRNKYPNEFAKLPVLFAVEKEKQAPPPPDPSNFVDVEVAVYRGLKPLYRFLGLFMSFSGLGDSERDMYRERGAVRNLSIRKARSPVVYEGVADLETFARENEFLGKPLLKAIVLGKTADLTPEFVWKTISTDTFEELLKARVYGAIKAAWKNLGAPFKEHGGIKLYMASEEVDAVFAELAGLRMRATQSGNAYPGFVRGGKTTYRVSSGIKTQRIMNARIGNLTLWMKKHVMWSKREGQLVVVGE